jgi:VIT1/CCC1 family predicted Fe2+/Mn2+ transporter
MQPVNSRINDTAFDRASYKATEQQTRHQIATSPTSVSENLYSIFSSYDIPSSTVEELVEHLSESPKCVDFLMRFEHTLSEPDGFRAITCALTIAGGYFFGGFIPLVPYMLIDKVDRALYWSIGIMIVALFLFGYAKTCFVIGWSGWKNISKGARGGVEMVVVGSVAAGAAMGLVMAFDHSSGAESG